MAPTPVKTQPMIETGPATSASDAGSRNTPEPTMLPITRAVAMVSPIVRFRFFSGIVALLGHGFQGESWPWPRCSRCRRLAASDVIRGPAP